MQILRGLHHPPVRVLFSPDGRLLAVGEERDTFRVWDLASGSADPLWSAWSGWAARHYSAFTADGRWIVHVNLDGLVRWNALTGERSEPRLTGMHSARFAPGGRVVVSKTTPAASVLQFRGVRPGPRDWVEVWRVDRRFDPDHSYGELLHSADGARFACVHSLPRGTRTEIEVFDTATGEAFSAWSGDLPPGAREGALGSDGSVALIHQRGLYGVRAALKKSEPVKRLNATPKHFTAAALAPDGARLATTSNDTAATIWDSTTWEVRKRYEWNIGRLRTVCFAPDGLRCAAAGDTGQVVVWDLDD